MLPFTAPSPAPPSQKKRRSPSYYRRQAIRKANLSSVSNPSDTDTVRAASGVPINSNNCDDEPTPNETESTKTSMDEEPLNAESYETYSSSSTSAYLAPSVDNSRIESGDDSTVHGTTQQELEHPGVTDVDASIESHFQPLFFCTKARRTPQ